MGLPRLGLPPTIWFGFVGALPAAAAVRKLWLNPEQTRQIVPAQMLTLLSFLLFAIGSGIGLLVGG